MLVEVYRYVGSASRSIVRAELVVEVEVEKLPRDQITFAQEHGGDFIEVADLAVA